MGCAAEKPAAHQFVATWTDFLVDWLHDNAIPKCLFRLAISLENPRGVAQPTVESCGKHHFRRRISNAKAGQDNRKSLQNLPAFCQLFQSDTSLSAWKLSEYWKITPSKMGIDRKFSSADASTGISRRA
jgi:hypothetical protein